MTLGLGLTLGAILGLLLASAFFSGSETALTAASRARMHALEQDGNSQTSQNFLTKRGANSDRTSMTLEDFW